MANSFQLLVGCQEENEIDFFIKKIRNMVKIRYKNKMDITVGNKLLIYDAMFLEHCVFKIYMQFLQNLLKIYVFIQ